jgi:hypothetical protein
MAETDDRLKLLAKAETVAFGGVGIASQILPATQAYFDLAENLDPQLRPKLERLLDKATPAGKVYAAALLSKLDPEAGRRAWQRLARERTPVSTFTGCIMGRTTLSEYASARLNAA